MSGNLRPAVVTVRRYRIRRKPPMIVVMSCHDFSDQLRSAFFYVDGIDRSELRAVDVPGLRIAKRLVLTLYAHAQSQAALAAIRDDVVKQLTDHGYRIVKKL